MTRSNRLNHLRFGLARLYAGQAPVRSRTTPGLHHLLAVPIRERLVLLAKLDGADPRTIAATLPVSREDAEGTSQAMQEAIALWQHALRDPFTHLPDRSGWRKRRNVQVERSLAALLWADVAVGLVGESTPARLRHLTLKQRLVLYLLLVEQLERQEVQTYMGCTEWAVREAINHALEAINPISTA